MAKDKSKPEEREYKEDPELGDDNEPDYREELFETFKALGWKPEDLKQDKKYAKQYRNWLKKNQ